MTLLSPPGSLSVASLSLPGLSFPLPTTPSASPYPVRPWKLLHSCPPHFLVPRLMLPSSQPLHSYQPWSCHTQVPMLPWPLTVQIEVQPSQCGIQGHLQLATQTLIHVRPRLHSSTHIPSFDLWDPSRDPTSIFPEQLPLLWMHFKNSDNETDSF